MQLLRAASEAGKTSRVQRTSPLGLAGNGERAREAGWNNYSLFLLPDGLLVGYLETENFQNARAGMAKREVNARWQRDMTDFFVPVDGAMPDRAMAPLEEVFHV